MSDDYFLYEASRCGIGGGGGDDDDDEMEEEEDVNVTKNSLLVDGW